MCVQRPKDICLIILLPKWCDRRYMTFVLVRLGDMLLTAHLTLVAVSYSSGLRFNASANRPTIQNFTFNSIDGAAPVALH